MATEVWYDVEYQVAIRIGELTSNYLQNHYAMVKVVGGLFGSSTEDKTSKPRELKNASDVAALNRMFGA